MLALLKRSLRRFLHSRAALALPVTFLILFVSTLSIISFTYAFSVERVNSQGQTLNGIALGIAGTLRLRGESAIARRFGPLIGPAWRWRPHQRIHARPFPGTHRLRRGAPAAVPVVAAGSPRWVPSIVVGHAAPSPALRLTGPDYWSNRAPCATHFRGLRNESYRPMNIRSEAPTGRPKLQHRPNPLVLPKKPKRLSPLSSGDVRGESCSCEWPDSNRHGVTHWYLNSLGCHDSKGLSDIFISGLHNQPIARRNPGN